MIELVAVVEPVLGAKPMRTGWRGLLDFGERWSAADVDLWPFREAPVGDPLTYGCEVQCDDEAAPGRVRIRLLMVDVLRPVMTPGASFTLRDGLTARATGRLL